MNKNFNILSHKLVYNCYKDEILLDLNIDLFNSSLDCDEEDYDNEENILEIHFDEISKNYICSNMFYLYNGECDSPSKEYMLNEEEKELVRDYILKENLAFNI